MTQTASRRTLLKSAALSGLGYWVSGGATAAESRSPNEKINIACVGMGGQAVVPACKR
jgi:uncharacterized protein (DUF1501 family)